MLKKLFKKIKSVAGDIAPYAGIIASGFGLGPLYSTLIGAGVPLIAGKPDQALAGGLGGYFGGKAFGSKAAGTYVSPLDIFKNTNVALKGANPGANKAARDLVLDRLKGAAQFKNLSDDNPFKFAPGVFGGLTIAQGLGLFGNEEQPDFTKNQFVYDPSQNVLPNVQQQFFDQAQDFDVIPNKPGGIEEYLRSIGLLANGGRSFQDGEKTGRSIGATAGMPVPKTPSTSEKINQMVSGILMNPDRIKTREFQFKLTTQEKDDIAKQIARDLGISSDSTDYENIYGMVMDADDKFGMQKKTESQPTLNQFIKSMIGKADGGVVGGDAINPIGGRIVGMGSGRQDLLEGEIVDPNTGQSQEIMVSNNEHVIPEFTLFALGGGDTEKGQQMMDDLRAKTKPMAKQMGYDFQGAEDGSMNYNPLMAQDGTQTRGPSMDMRKMVQKLMAQGKSIEEIMAIIQRLRTDSQTRQQQMPMIAADGMETNGLQRMSEKMQDGSMTADPMMMAGLGSVIKGLEDAQRLDRMTR
jgi:hypothetical protein